MDFIMGLPRAFQVDTILVVVDRLTKYSHFLTLKHSYTARDVASLFIKEIARLHGFPHSIVSDRDRVFISHFLGEIFKQSGTQLRMSSAYHPQTDGKIGLVAYLLQLPSTAWILVFHVSQLKKTTFPPSNVQSLPTALDEDLILAIEPEVVLKKRKLLNGDDNVELERLKMKLANDFEIKDLGTLKYFLGMEFATSKEGIFVNQRKYVLDLLVETSLLGSKAAKTPIETNMKL
ncbi:uncharacterized protein LOC116121996 [Pistacia vera]|uniref:uncharacterized protein LOC116121996 n=1 Tax=Pistacia vera TaxID=55513 RepID=UPI00126333FA|nr:uncharacterized protein LOC116121996 [Pistacia vera]